MHAVRILYIHPSRYGMIRFYNTPNRISINVFGNVYILMNAHIVDKFILWAFYCGEIKMDVVELS